MDAVQMEGTGKSEWTQIQIDGESLLIWTIRLDECQNKCPYTVNLVVQKTPYGLGSLYAVHFSFQFCLGDNI